MEYTAFDIQEKMAAYIRHMGFKLNVLREKVGVSNAMMTNYLNCTDRMPLDVYFKLCDAMDVPLGKFHPRQEAS